jgi:hypothetical protein
MATDIAQTIQKRLREIDEELKHAGALQDERDTLQRILKELGGTPRRAGRASSRPSAGSRAKRSRRAAPRSRSKRAPRGTNQRAILEFVRANPGSPPPAIAEATDIPRAIVYSAVSRLTANGTLEKSTGSNGGVTYTLA